VGRPAQRAIRQKILVEALGLGSVKALGAPQPVEISEEKMELVKSLASSLQGKVMAHYVIRMPSGNAYFVPVWKANPVGRYKRPPLSAWRDFKKRRTGINYTISCNWKLAKVMSKLEEMMYVPELHATPAFLDALLILVEDYERVVEQLKEERRLREELGKILRGVLRVEAKVDDVGAYVREIYNIVSKLAKVRDDVRVIRSILHRVEEKLGEVEELIKKSPEEAAKTMTRAKALLESGEEWLGELERSLPDFVADNPWVEEISKKGVEVKRGES